MVAIESYGLVYMNWAVEYKMRRLARSQVKAAIGLGWTPLA